MSICMCVFAHVCDKVCVHAHVCVCVQVCMHMSAGGCDYVCMGACVVCVLVWVHGPVCENMCNCMIVYITLCVCKTGGMPVSKITQTFWDTSEGTSFVLSIKVIV